MKKVRRILCLLVSIFMLPIMAVSVSAEDVTTAEEQYIFSEKWQKPEFDSGYTSNDNYAFIEPTNKVARGGSGHSAHFYIQKTVYNQNIRLKTNKTFSAGTYTIEFYAKYNNSYFQAYLDSENKIYYANAMNPTKQADGWYKLSTSITLSNAQSISIRAFGDIHLYIDDVKITNSSNEVVFSDDFESVRNIVAENNYDFSSNWQTPEYASDFTSDGNSAFIEPTSRVAQGGSGHSIHYYCKKKVGASKYATLKTSKTFEKGTYTVEFDAKSNASYKDSSDFRGGYNNIFYCVYADSTNKSINADNGSITKTTTSDGWTHLSVSMELTAASTMSIRIFYYIQLYVDNVKITNSSGNVVFSDDFENVTEKSKNVDNLLASPNPATDGSGSLIVSWTNPAGGRVESSDIYVDGDKYERDVTIDTTAGAFNKVTVTGLTDKQKYTIKLSQKLWEENQNREYETTGMPDACGSSCNFGDWAIGRQLQCDFDLEKEEDGNTAMKIYANIPTAVANTYASASQTLTLNRDTNYKLSFKAKSKNLHSFLVMTKFTNTVNDTRYETWNYWSPVGKNVDGWTEYSQILSEAERKKADNTAHDDKDLIYDPSGSGTYEVNIQFIVNSAEGWVALDDVKLYALDPMDTTKTAGDNLIKNGDFERTYDVLKPEYSLISGDSESESTSTPITALQQGKVEVTAKIKNYMVNGFSPTIIFALYNGKQLVEATVVNKDMPITSAVIPADEVTTMFNVPALDSGEYSIRTFYFNGMTSICPLASQSEITEPVVTEQ